MVVVPPMVHSSLNGVIIVFFSSSVQLKSYKKGDITVNDDSFEVDNNVPASLFLGNEDQQWLCSLSELEQETIPVKSMEMICSEHLMRKALRHSSVLINDEVHSKQSSTTDIEGNAFIPAMAVTEQIMFPPNCCPKESNEFQSEAVDMGFNVAEMSLIKKITVVHDPSHAPVRGRGRAPGRGASSHGRGNRESSSHHSRGGDTTLPRGRGRRGRIRQDAIVSSTNSVTAGVGPETIDHGVGSSEATVSHGGPLPYKPAVLQVQAD